MQRHSHIFPALFRSLPLPVAAGGCASNPALQATHTQGTQGTTTREPPPVAGLHPIYFACRVRHWTETGSHFHVIGHSRTTWAIASVTWSIKEGATAGIISNGGL